MDTRALRYFQAVAEFGSYSRGAEFLRISQPAVSRRVRSLEQELGGKLFIRHSRGVILTDTGRRLLERSQTILRHVDQAGDDLRRGRDGPAETLTLAVPPAAGNVLVPELARRFAAVRPDVFLKIVAGFSTYIHEWLVRGRVDLACLHDPVPQPGFAVTPLVREEVFLVGRRGALAPPRGQLRVQDLAGLPLVLPGRPNASRRLLDMWLARGGVRLDIRMEVDDHLIIRALLKAGLGFSLLTQGAFRADLPLGELEAWKLRPRAFWQLAMMQGTGDRRGAALATLAELVRTTAHDLVAANAWPGAAAP